MKRFGVFAALCMGFLTAAPPLAAQDDLGRKGVEIHGYYGVLNGIGTPEFDEDPVPFGLDNNHLMGGRLGYVLENGVGIEGYFGYLRSGLEQLGVSDVDATVLNYGGNLVYNFNLEPSFQLFIAAGAGVQSWDIDQTGLDTETALAITYGAGVKLFPKPWLALRADWHNYHSPDGLKDTRALFSGAGLEDKTLYMTEWTAGISIFVGGPRDADGDGVSDSMDQCPNTPAGATVDANGCPLDTDGDGVADYMDRCPDTPRGARVDAEGCPMDSDGDGVFDGIDTCPNTPKGATVDAKGCPSDADGDGVFDGIDTCPNTPKGATVDAKGCPGDTDGDGVLNGIDKCPNTPAGAEIDANGCTVVQAGLAAGRLVLENVEFALNRAEIRDVAKPILDEVGQALLDRPNMRVEVQGHTDSSGSDAYNLQLSQQRAQAVLDYLLGKYPTLNANRFTAKGYGEADPIAPNNTSEGRAKNRRVQFVVQQ